MSRILAVDWGEKRFGIALTDPLNLTAQPLTVLHSKKNETPWEGLRKLVQEYDVETVVVGLPLRTDGTPGEKEARVQAWVEEAKEKFPHIRFVMIDERFSSKEALRILEETKERRKIERPLVDKYAAAIILEQFLRMNPKL